MPWLPVSLTTVSSASFHADTSVAARENPCSMAFKFQLAMAADLQKSESLIEYYSRIKQ
ncbi:MAG: hypothetical protein WBA37_19525 [Xanthobacteraceae bacterium]|nr:hypothetical protein [Hyphomicrobiales bacterium]MBN9014721.1 hypothetical protein [Hyphomicrobiales bacterium]